MKLLTLSLCLLCGSAFGQAFGWRDTPFLIKTFTATSSGPPPDCSGTTGGVFANLTHYWNMNQASGNVRTDSVGSAALTETGGAVASATGICGSAADFSASSTHTLVSSAFQLASSGNPWSINLWVNLVSNGAANRALLSKDASTDVFETYFSDLTAAVVLTDSAQVCDTSGLGTVGAFNAWHMITITSDASGVLVGYIDAVQLDSGGCGDLTGSGALSLGTAPDAIDGALNGKIDEVGIWNIQLTGANVTTLWNSGAGRFYRP